MWYPYRRGMRAGAGYDPAGIHLEVLKIFNRNRRRRLRSALSDGSSRGAEARR